MQSLEELRLDAPLSLDSLLEFALALSGGLAELHAQDLVHGDLRPFRIRWDGAQDLDLLPPEDAPGKAQLRRVSYWSPEQCSGEAPGPRSEIFIVGILLQEMATGEHPFLDHDIEDLDEEDAQDVMEAIQFRRAELPGRLRPELCLEWDAILSICMAKDPRERYASALDLEKELQKLAREGGRARICFRPHWPRITLALILLGACLLALYLLL